MMIRFALILFSISLLIAGGAYALYSFPVFTIKEVRIVGSDRIDAGKLAVSCGMNLFEVDLEQLVTTLRAHRYVESASAKCDLYGSLLINVIEKEPVAYLYDDRLHAVSRRCELLPLETTDSFLSLPVIRGVDVDSVQLYAMIGDPGLHAAARLLNEMRQENTPCLERLSEIVVSTTTMKLIFEPGSVVANIGWGNYHKKLEMLERVLATNKNPGLDLDLRMVDLAVMKTRIVHNKDREVNNGI